MVDHVKSFREVNRHGQRAEWGIKLVETLGYIMGERAKTVEYLVRKPRWMDERGREFRFGCRRHSRNLTAG